MSNNKLKEILSKYKIRKEDYYQNEIRSIEMDSNSYPGLTLRESKALKKELLNYNLTLNKTKDLTRLKDYYYYNLQNEIIYKTEEPEVNQILEGGFKGGYIYKIMGPLQSGKTTLINSLVRANINNNIKILYFSFIEDNIDSDLLSSINSKQNSNITIVENIYNFNELLLSEYFRNKGENLKKYNIIIFDAFTIILHKETPVDYTLLNDFNEILNVLSWRNNICFIFSIYCRKLNNTFWYYQNDQKDIERLILRSYESFDVLKNTPNCVKIYLYKMKKHSVIKYFMKVISFNFKKTSNFIEWELNS